MRTVPRRGVGRADVLRRGEAQPAVGGDDEDHAMPLGGGSRHRAGGEQRLVVGVGVKGHQCPSHVAAIVSHDILGSVKVALLSDCYLPRLGGIEVQVHDLAAQLHGPGSPGGGVHGDARHPRGAARATEEVDGITVHRMALRLPWDLPVNPFAPADDARRGWRTFDVAHVHMGVVSPFAVDAAFLTTRLGLPTAMTWHCMLDRFARWCRLLGVVRRWAAAGWR